MPRILALAGWLLFAAMLAAAPAGCWPGEEAPVGPPTGTCNHNGTCELDLAEDAFACPDDCAPCNAVEIQTVGSVTDPENALGAPDGLRAQLGPGSSVTLQVGLEIHADQGSDLVLVGEVTSESSTTVGDDLCTDFAPSSGAFVVEVRADDSGWSWSQVGYWAKTSSSTAGGTAGQFNLSCSGLKSARFVRLTAQDDATATLDALDAIHCVK